MTNMPTYDELHDATLDMVSLDWQTGIARLAIRLEYEQVVLLDVLAIGTKLLLCPRREEWGISRFINHVTGPFSLDAGGVRLQIEMQTGDTIEIEAAEIRLVRESPESQQRI